MSALNLSAIFPPMNREDVDPRAQVTATDDPVEDNLKLTERAAASIEVEEIHEVHPLTKKIKRTVWRARGLLD